VNGKTANGAFVTGPTLSVGVHFIVDARTYR
jgi:hypothetical protein